MLAITGTEALYADMGHFSAAAIRVGPPFSFLSFLVPSLGLAVHVVQHAGLVALLCCIVHRFQDWRGRRKGISSPCCAPPLRLDTLNCCTRHRGDYIFCNLRICWSFTSAWATLAVAAPAKPVSHSCPARPSLPAAELCDGGLPLPGADLPGSDCVCDDSP